MSSAPAGSGMQGVYDFWIGLLPQFLGQMGAAVPGGDKAAPASLAGLPFPADQVARAAAMTQEALQSLGRSFAPMLSGANPQGLLAQWAALMPQMPMMPMMAAASPAASATAGAIPNPFAPWMSAMSQFAGMPAAGTDGAGALPAAMPSLQSMQQAWLDAAGRMTGATPQAFETAFDRTLGGLSDALGLGPVRKLQSAWQELIAASYAQNEARASYAMLVQSAFASGLEKLTARLAEMAKSGERVDSVLALVRLWAVSTEAAVHDVLQSEKGLAATAVLSRAGVAHRKKLQQVAGIVADALDMSTRRELDEAFREIQALKREVRALRSSVQPAVAPPPARASKGKAK